LGNPNRSGKRTKVHEMGSAMINTSTRETSKANDNALLRVIALSLNPRLRTAGMATREADYESGPGPLCFDRTAGSAFTNDV
jgi:hypothetical protein